MLAAADAKVPFGIRLTQGSYNPGGVGASAGTHDGGGVVDVTVTGLTTTQRWHLVRALRTVGFAAWLRTPAQGFSYHVHAVAIGDPDIWQRDGGHVARDQVCDYYKGLNGLASHAADNTPSAYRVVLHLVGAVQGASPDRWAGSGRASAAGPPRRRRTARPGTARRPCGPGWGRRGRS